MKNNIKNNKNSFIILAVSILLVTLGTVWSMARAQQAVSPSTPTPTRYLVSQIIGSAHASSGCNWLTGTRTGGSACYDDSTVLNAALALSTAANPIDLVFDVSVGIGSPLLIPVSPSLTIEGLSAQTTGVFVLSGSNTTAICSKISGQSGCGVATAGSAPSTSGSVVVRNFGVNGNAGTYPSGNSNATDGRCTSWCFGIHVSNTKFYSLENVHLYDIPTFASLSDNVDRQEYTNVRIDAPSLGLNTDGIHMDGPAGTYDINGVYCHTGDDCVAINAPEGYGGNMGVGTVANETLSNAQSCARLYGSGAGHNYLVSPVSFSNIVGSLKANNGLNANCFVLGDAGPGAAGEIQGLHADGINLNTPDFGSELVSIKANATTISLHNVYWNPSQAAQFVFGYNGTSSAVGNFDIDGLHISGAGWSPAIGQIPSGATMTSLELNDIVSYSPIPYALDIPSGGSLTYLIMNSLNPVNITSLLNGNEWARVTNFTGAGISAFYRNTVYSKLPPATYTGLTASISDSTTQTWGATAAGSSTSYALLTSDGTNWTVIGK